MTKSMLAIAALFAAVALPALADPAPTVQPVFRHEITNIPGKSLVSVVVSYPPGGTSRPHRHAGSAFIFAYVLSGAIRSQVDDEPAKVYHAGESFFEVPGAHHRVSENASATEPAQLLATLFVDSSEKVLTTQDPQ